MSSLTIYEDGADLTMYEDWIEDAPTEKERNIRQSAAYLLALASAAGSSPPASELSSPKPSTRRAKSSKLGLETWDDLRPKSPVSARARRTTAASRGMSVTEEAQLQQAIELSRTEALVASSSAGVTPTVGIGSANRARLPLTELDANAAPSTGTKGLSPSVSLDLDKDTPQKAADTRLGRGTIDDADTETSKKGKSLMRNSKNRPGSTIGTGEGSSSSVPLKRDHFGIPNKNSGSTISKVKASSFLGPLKRGRGSSKGKTGPEADIQSARTKMGKEFNIAVDVPEATPKRPQTFDHAFRNQTAGPKSFKRQLLGAVSGLVKSPSAGTTKSTGITIHDSNSDDKSATVGKSAQNPGSTFNQKPSPTSGERIIRPTIQNGTPATAFPGSSTESDPK